MNNMDVRNILWDVDGTLFDTYPAITYALSKALNELGLSIALNVIDGLARQSISHCIKTLSQRFKLDPDLLRQRFAEAYRKLDPVNQPPFPGVREVCEFIHEHGGLNIAVSHRGVQSTQMLLDAHGLAPFFTAIFNVAQGYPRKPNQAIVLAALEVHTLDPDHTLLVGDRDKDIQAGRAAGVRTCLFGRTDLEKSPELCIQHYHQLLDLLKAEKSA
jgi:HAD superfamily hydrolase (TIGR01509 family)